MSAVIFFEKLLNFPKMYPFYGQWSTVFKILDKRAPENFGIFVKPGVFFRTAMRLFNVKAKIGAYVPGMFNFDKSELISKNKVVKRVSFII